MSTYTEEMDYSDGEEEYLEVTVTRKDKNKSAVKKRKRVGRACVHCQRSHMSCDDQRPCKRCVSRGCGDQCRDGKRKRRGRKRKSTAEDDESDDEEDFSSEAEPMSYSPVKPKRIKTQEMLEEDVDVDGSMCNHSQCGGEHHHPVAQPHYVAPTPSRFHQPQLFSALAQPQPHIAAPVATAAFTASGLLHPQPSYSRMHTSTHPILNKPAEDVPVRDFSSQTTSPILAFAPTPSPAPVDRPATPHTPVPYLDHLNFAPESESDLCVSGGWGMKLDRAEVDLDHYFHTDMVAQRAQLLSFNYEMDESSSSSDEFPAAPMELLC